MTPAQYAAKYMGKLVRSSFTRNHNSAHVGFVTAVKPEPYWNGGEFSDWNGFVNVAITTANGNVVTRWIHPDNDPDNWHLDLPGEEHP